MWKVVDVAKFASAGPCLLPVSSLSGRTGLFLYVGGQYTCMDLELKER